MTKTAKKAAPKKTTTRKKSTPSAAVIKRNTAQATADRVVASLAPKTKGKPRAKIGTPRDFGDKAPPVYKGGSARLPEPVSERDQPAPQGRCYIAIGQFVWGKGQTINEALKKMRAAGGSKRYIVYEAQHDATVTPMGQIEYRYPEGYDHTNCGPISSREVLRVAPRA